MPLLADVQKLWRLFWRSSATEGGFRGTEPSVYAFDFIPFIRPPPKTQNMNEEHLGEGVAAVHMVRPFQDTSHVADGWKHTMDSCNPTSFARQRIRTDCSSTWKSLLKPCTTAATGGRGRYKNPCRRTRKTNRETLLRFFLCCGGLCKTEDTCGLCSLRCCSPARRAPRAAAA